MKAARKNYLGLLISSILIQWGCAGVHLHNPADQTLATKAQSLFQEARLAEGITEERKRLDEILKRELAVVRRHAIAQMDAELIAFTGNTTKAESWDYFKVRVNTRGAELVGENQLVSFLLASNELANREDRLRFRSSLYDINRNPSDPKLFCPQPPGADFSKTSETQRIIVNAYDNDCAALLKAQNTIEAIGPSGSEWQKLQREIRKIIELRAKDEKELQVLQAKYLAAKKAYQDAAKPAKTDNAVELAEELKKILATIASVGKLGMLKGFEEQRKSVEELLDAVIKNKGGANPEVKADEKVTLVIASSIPSLERQIGQALNYPKVSALLIESEHLRLQAEGVRRSLAREDARLRLLNAKVIAMKREAGFLNNAKKYLDGLLPDMNQSPTTPSVNPASTNETCRGTGGLAADYTNAKLECREIILRALLDHVNSWIVGRLPQEEIDYVLISQFHQAALDDSEVALMQWQNLVGVPLSQLVVYHSSGIKPEDIANFVNVIGLGGIAVGVNR